METKGFLVFCAGTDFLPAQVLVSSLISEDTFKVGAFRIFKYFRYMGCVEITLALKCTLQMGDVCCWQGTEKCGFVQVEPLVGAEVGCMQESTWKMAFNSTAFVKMNSRNYQDVGL